MKQLLAVIIYCFCFSNSFAQAPQSWSSAEMYLAIRKLNVLGSVLYVAAHPDDENTRLIAYFAKDRMCRAGYLSLTRGDGGQNLIGNEQGIELGLIRTQELLAARRIDGGEQFFSRAYDFGYSKSPDETFTKWDRDKILSDVVWVIRKFRPDVIITRFPTTGEGGHGHHTASAILANEAFTAAADPGRFPAQLKFVETWQPKRILWNSFNFGGTNLTSPDQFSFDVGGYNPLLGKSYGEIAAISRSNHKSQGFGSAAGRGETLEYFKTTGGPAPTRDILEDVDLSWKRVPGGEIIIPIVDSIASRFDLLHPELSVKGLVRLHSAISSLPESYWKHIKLQETLELISQCSGLFMDATTPEQFAVKTDSIRINFRFNNQLGSAAILKRLHLLHAQQLDTVFNKSLEKNKNFIYSKTFYVPPYIVETQPYWLEEKMAEGYFNVSDQTRIGQPDVDPSFQVKVLVNIEGKDLEFVRPVKFRFTDPVKGELYEPLVVLPPLVLIPDEELKMTRDENQAKGIVKVQAKKKNVWATMSPVLSAIPDKFSVEFEPNQVFLQDKNSIAEIEYKIKANRDNEYSFGARADSSKVPGKKTESVTSLNQYYKSMHEVRYDHIPYISYFTNASVTNRKLDLKTYHKKIGYIIGAGDKVPEALEQMGYEVVLLTDKELSRNNLGQYDAILTGVRAYNTNEWMNRHYSKLMKYVHEGGNLIVQYNTSNNIGPVRAKMGPYNFNISRTRVTDENAPVLLLKPEHAVFNFPNKIQPEDFSGWVQERSIYHASSRYS